MLLPGLLPRPGPTPLCWGWDAQTLPAGGMAVLAAADLISPVRRLGFCWEVFEVYFELLPLSPVLSSVVRQTP